MRVGQGFDAHRLIDGDHLMLGGVRVPHDRGVDAHSDGDVLIHALCDALLGACAAGDLGRHFPNTERWRGAAGVQLLEATVKVCADAGFVCRHADLTFIAEAPRIAEHVPAMRAALAERLGLDAEAVSIKATTTDGLGVIGRGEGVAALAVATVEAR